MEKQNQPAVAAFSTGRLRIAVIGAGLGSAPHFHSLEDLAGEAELTWVYGRSAERLAGVRLPAQARKTTRIEDIFEDASVKAVLVLTPPNTHLDIVQRAARAGKHVLVEKPLEINLGRATRLVQSCETAGVTLAVMRSTDWVRRYVHSRRCSIQANSANWSAPPQPFAGGARKAITTNRDAARWRGTAAAC